jgi:tetratricopeptide (TPR) repeat protein
MKGLTKVTNMRSFNGAARVIPALLGLLAMIVVPAVCRGDADKIYKDNSAAVVVVVSIDDTGRVVGQGSGFIVRDDGAVVTNYHVINMAKDIKIKMGYKVRDVEGLLHVDAENDLAILKVEGKDYPKVKLGDANKAKVGEKVYVIGSPQGLENTISEGILSGIREIDAQRKILQMTAAISPGSSGGPVFNSRGEVVGIATFLIADTQNLNFALPINLVMGGLTKKTLVSPQDACKLDYTETAACWFYQGLAYGTLGRYESAAGAFQRSLAIDAKQVETYINLGVSYARLEKYEEAREAFTEALKLDPNRPEALSNLAAIYSQLERFDDAVATFRKAITFKPEDPQTRYNLGVTYVMMGRHKEAIEEFREAIRLQPDYAEAQAYLGLSYTGLGMYPEAAAAYKAAIRLSPDDPSMHLGLGKAYASMGDRGQALEEYKVLMKLNRPMADALFEVIYK